MSCLFCKMLKGEIPYKSVYEDDNFFAIKDIAPIAPIHILIIPKLHIKDAAELKNRGELAAEIFEIAEKIAAEQGMNNGYRLITNIGDEGGQSIAHLHFHLLGGKKLEWPNI